MPKRVTTLAALLALALALPGLPALAEGPGVSAEDAWARPTVPDRPGAAYMTLTNGGDTADRLVAAESPEAGRVELHTTEMEGDVMRMRRVEGIEVPAGGSVDLAPGGFHVMLFDLAEPLSAGGTLPLTLVFETAGEVEVEAAVERRGGMSGHDGHSMEGMEGHGGD